MPNSLHIRLQAPLEWRINNVSSREMISLSEAKKKIAQIDAQRNQLHHYFVGKDPDNTIFDVVFNYSTLSDDEIIGAILNMMELKDMI
jgi:cytidylate kinase